MEVMTHKNINAKGADGELSLDVLTLKKVALVLRAINHPLRQQILKLLHQHRRMAVSELYKKLHLEQSVASQHLAILRKAGFVVTEREGKFIFYAVNHARLKQVHQFSRDILTVGM